MTIERPRFVSVPLKEGLQWKPSANFIYEEKMDGVWSHRCMYDSIIIGEQMKNGDFFAFDIVRFVGDDISDVSLRQRLQCLDLFCKNFPVLFSRPARGIGGEFLEAVLSNGGEGVVCKDLDSHFGAEWFKCKRVETFDLVVTEKAVGKMSIRLAEPTGEDRGWCPCFSEFENIRVGEVVEISCYAISKNGKLREPRFIRRRPDKSA